MMSRVQEDLPTGTVTFLFTDIEGSTVLLRKLGPERYADALADHRSTLRTAFAAHGGIELGTEGDAFFVAFPDRVGRRLRCERRPARARRGRRCASAWGFTPAPRT